MSRYTQCLNGNWQFQPDIGELQYPPSSNWAETPIRIPSPWNVNRFYPEKGGDFRYYPSYPKEWETTAAGWHRRNFIVPERWQGNRIALQFEGVHFFCVVYVNGKQVATHEDGFIPFEVEITNHVRFGESNELLVGVKSFVFYTRQSPLEAKSKYTYPTGSFWGMTVSGIWQDVFLITYPLVRIADVFIQPSIRKKQVTIATTLKNETDEMQSIYLTHSISTWERFAENVSLPAHAEKTISISRSWSNPHHWHPEDPYLYQLKTTLVTITGIKDEQHTRFGFREFWIDKDRFILNGKAIKLRGDAWHYLGIPYQTPVYAQLWYQLAKETNLNHIRLHAQIYPRYYLDLADELGILITDETAIWASHCAYHYTPEFWRRAKNHVTALVKRDRNHPSVIIWSVENEALPAYGFVKDDVIKNEDALASRIYDLVKVINSYDETRPISADGSFDLCGRAKIYNIHYPPLPQIPVKNKSIVVGEMGSMYYSTPDEVSPLLGESVYLSFSERLKAIAIEQEQMISLVRKWANGVCPFNIVWYGLEPLPFSGKRIAYTQLDTPGPKPERIGQYVATLNPGYDTKLSKWKPNALYPHLKQLLLPIRFFIHERAKSYFAETSTRLHFTVHNDSYHKKQLKLYWSLQSQNPNLIVKGKIPTSLRPANKRNVELVIRIPAVSKRKNLVLLLQLKENRQVVYQEKRNIPVVPNQALGKIPTWPKISALTEKRYMLLPPKSNISSDEITSIQYGIRNGLRVIVLEKNDPVLSGLRYTAVEPGKYDRAFIQLDRHPVLRGVRNEDLRFWGKEELVAEVNIANFPKGNFRPLINLGNGKPVLIELVDGLGTYFISTLNIMKYAKTEPGAQILYNNLVDYVSRYIPQTFSQTMLVGKPNSKLRTFFDYLGVDYALSENLNPDMVNRNKLTTIIVDGSLPLDKDTRKTMSVFIKRGGIALIWGLTPEAVDSYAGLFPYPLVLLERDIEHLVKTKPDPMLAGIHAGDLYWIERDRKNPILRYSIKPKRNHNFDILLGVPSLDWRVWNWEAEPVKTAAIMKSERAKTVPANGLVRFRMGKGMLLVNQLCFEKTNLIKSGKLASLLLTNLRIRLNPEKAIQFAVSNQQENISLLLSPIGKS